MKQTKFVVSVLLLVVSLLLYFIAGVSLYSIMRVTKFNFMCIVIATILMIYKKELVYLLVGRNLDKESKQSTKRYTEDTKNT